MSLITIDYFLSWLICLHVIKDLSTFQMLSGLTQSETWKQTRPNILPKKYKKLENSIDSLISDRSVSQMRIPLMKSCPFLTHHSPPDSAPVRKMANKEYFILRYFQRIRKLHYLLLHSFTGQWNISSSLEQFPMQKFCSSKFPPFINEFTHFLHFVVSNALSNDERYQKHF